MKKYKSPVVMLTPEPEDPDIPFGPSGGTYGFDAYEFVGFEGHEDDLAMLQLNCEQFDLEDMDDGDFVITYDEFKAWYDEKQPW